jgi:UDP:flavonoid glycosyltransferase YjiC (YdhE family)
MSRFLICTLPLAGHVNPGLPIARALAARGHEVWWYTGRQFRLAIEATGARHVPMQAAATNNDQAFFPSLPKLSGLAAANWGIKRAFIDPIPGQVADLQRILAEFPADVLINDQVFLGAEALYTLGGPPWATLGISALTLSSRDTAPFNTTLPPNASTLGRLRNRLLNALLYRVALRDAANHLNYVRWSIGIPPLRQTMLELLSPFLYMHSSTPAFEYPRSDLPPQVHFIGPLLPDPPHDFAPPAWWDDLRAGRPVVLVNQGTVATDTSDLIVPTLRALAGEDLLVIATTGGTPADQLGAELPSNARVEPFIPFGALLPHVDVMITNGGYGGVQFALAHGVPLIVAGATEEKPAIAARVAWSGAGINLRTRSPSPGQLRSAVRDALANPHYRQNAERIRDDYANHNAPQAAVALLERLAATGQPVLRTEALAQGRLRPIELDQVKKGTT